MAQRLIIKIDEELCTGCGDCVVACAEGAIEIVDGKARLISETYCDGLGACLGECPEGALVIEERQADAFDEEAVRDRLAALWARGEGVETPASCPSMQVMEFEDRQAPGTSGAEGATQAGSALTHWPIKLRLVPPGAPFLPGAELMLIADCVGFAWGDLRRELSSENAVLIGCPKFDDYDFALSRLTEILRGSQVRSLTIVHMEVSCCAGYWHLGQQAWTAAGKEIPLRQVVIGARGEVKQDGERSAALLRIEPPEV